MENHSYQIQPQQLNLPNSVVTADIKQIVERSSEGVNYSTQHCQREEATSPQEKCPPLSFVDLFF